MKILIVEDDASIANLIKMNLAAIGYECTCASDGKAGADYFMHSRNYPCGSLVSLVQSRSIRQ